ncbi:unnamed protein product [Pelagomonas calceolata]|uniref:Uncharacterized protein n=1 Tax=Pelagomonas calceolata TaxID=35677 RepID=A0A8J2SYV6_9STRA|nr:unnamed protein product [Pelagomonas calceolata]
MGARAARTTSFMRWPGMAWTVRDPILTGTVFFWVERPLPAFGLLSKDSFLKALSKKPLRGVSGARCGALGTRPTAALTQRAASSRCMVRVSVCCFLGVPCNAVLRRVAEATDSYSSRSCFVRCAGS